MLTIALTLASLPHNTRLTDAPSRGVFATTMSCLYPRQKAHGFRFSDVYSVKRTLHTYYMSGRPCTMVGGHRFSGAHESWGGGQCDNESGADTNGASQASKYGTSFTCYWQIHLAGAIFGTNFL